MRVPERPYVIYISSSDLTDSKARARGKIVMLNVRVKLFDLAVRLLR